MVWFIYSDNLDCIKIYLLYVCLQLNSFCFLLDYLLFRPAFFWLDLLLVDSFSEKYVFLVSRKWAPGKESIKTTVLGTLHKSVLSIRHNVYYLLNVYEHQLKTCVFQENRVKWFSTEIVSKIFSFYEQINILNALLNHSITAMLQTASKFTLFRASTLWQLS